MKALLKPKSAGGIAFDIVNIAFMAAVCLAILYPFLNLVSVSLSQDGYVMRGEVTIWPLGFDLDAYDMVFENRQLIRAYGNTILVAVTGCAASLVFTSMAAYPMVFSNFIGKKAYTLMIVLTLWFSGGIIPTFLVIRSIGLIDSLGALVFNALISAYNVVIMRSFYGSIPASVVESARLDGANDFLILFRLIWPLSKPVLATIALWVVVLHWNDYFAPLMFLTSFEKSTLQLVLKDIVLSASSTLYDIGKINQSAEGGNAAISEQVKCAVLVVSMLPMLAVYPFLQRYFVSGIMLGAVKG